MLKRLYEWVLSWANSPYASPALFIMAFAEASFFPIPPDVLLLAMAMGAPERAIRFAFICTAGSVLGAIAGYALGWGLWGIMDQWFYHYVPGFSEAVFIQLSQSFSDNAFVALFTAGFTPIPFKIFTVAAGAAAVPLILFIFTAILSRGLRYGLLALLIRQFGEGIKEWIDRYFNLLTVLLTGIIIIMVILLQL
ncbi:MAG: YqaA family protein [Pseudomonadota bacterium]|nr:YqaA family protein [Pseudomonadota bacterium]